MFHHILRYWNRNSTSVSNFWQCRSSLWAKTVLYTCRFTRSVAKPDSAVCWEFASICAPLPLDVDDVQHGKYGQGSGQTSLLVFIFHLDEQLIMFTINILCLRKSGFFNRNMKGIKPGLWCCITHCHERPVMKGENSELISDLLVLWERRDIFCVERWLNWHLKMSVTPSVFSSRPVCSQSDQLPLHDRQVQLRGMQRISVVWEEVGGGLQSPWIH